MLYAAQKMSAQACMGVDSDISNITPEWVKWVFDPVLGTTDLLSTEQEVGRFGQRFSKIFFSPFYNVEFGVNIPQPLPSVVGLSSSFFKSMIAEKSAWTSYVSRYGLETWQLAHAYYNGYKIQVCPLGFVRHNPRNVLQLCPMILQILDTVFLIRQTYGGPSHSHEKDTPISYTKDTPNAFSQDMSIPGVSMLKDIITMGYWIFAGDLKDRLPQTIFDPIMQRLKNYQHTPFLFEDELYCKALALLSKKIKRPQKPCTSYWKELEILFYLMCAKLLSYSYEVAQQSDDEAINVIDQLRRIMAQEFENEGTKAEL